MAPLAYGFFLSISTARTATHMTITIIIAATPNIRLLVDARPETGEGYGDAVGAAALA